MEADVASEPVQLPRQIVERATLDSRAMELPLRVLAPVRVLELVLGVKEPHTQDTADQRDRNLHEQEAIDADQVVGNPRAKEGAVAAVVLKSEQPGQQAGGGQRREQREPGSLGEGSGYFEGTQESSRGGAPQS